MSNEQNNNTNDESRVQSYMMKMKYVCSQHKETATFYWKSEGYSTPRTSVSFSSASWSSDTEQLFDTPSSSSTHDSFDGMGEGA